MKKLCSLLISICILAVSGCTPRKRESVISADRFYAAMEQYDAEEYDSYLSLSGELENERAMLAGMYCDILPEPDKSTSGIYFVQGLENDDGSTVKIEGYLYSFEDEDDASEYYISYCEEMEEREEEDDRKTVFFAAPADASTEYSYRTVFWRRNLECEAVWHDYDHVLLLVGSEFKSNDLQRLYDELCGQFDIPSPDLSDWDCNELLDSDERMPELVDAFDAEEIDPTEFDINWELMEAGCYHVRTDDFESIAGSLDEGRLSLYRDVTNTDLFFCIDSDPNDLRASRYVVMRVECTDEDAANGFYEGMKDDVAGRTAMQIDIIDSGEEQGISFTRYKITDPYMSASYSLYCEGSCAYVLSFLNMDEQVAEDTLQDVCDIMGLP